MASRKFARKRALRAVLSLGLALVLAATAACGSEGEAGKDGLTEVNVGIIPIVAVAPLALGIDKGFFEEEGLDVRLHVAEGGAALVPAVVSGQYNFAFSNNVSLLLARAKGLPLQIVAAANSAGEDPEPIEEALAVAKGSPIKSPADLEGKTVAVNTLNNIVEVANRAAIEEAGADPNKVKFIEVKFPDMPQALKQGRVDAADIAEPFLTVAKEEGATVISHPFRVLEPDLNISSWFASQEFLASNAEIADKFTKALDRSKAYATEHQDEIRKIVPEFLDVDPDLANKMALAYWPEGLPKESSLTKLHEHLVKLDLLKESALPDPTVVLRGKE